MTLLFIAKILLSSRNQPLFPEYFSLNTYRFDRMIPAEWLLDKLTGTALNRGELTTGEYANIQHRFFIKQQL
jgi:hypothetical protein